MGAPLSLSGGARVEVGGGARPPLVHPCFYLSYYPIKIMNPSLGAISKWKYLLLLKRVYLAKQIDKSKLKSSKQKLIYISRLLRSLFKF